MTDSSSPVAPRRPRTELLLLLGVAVVAIAVYMLWPSAARPSAPSNPSREQRKQAASTSGESPQSLTVDLGALKQVPPAPGEGARNPFRFYVPPPPPPPVPKMAKPGEPGYVAPAPPRRVPQPGDPDYVPPPPPPIPLKFIGTVEMRGRKVAIFVSNDGRGMPQYAGEGELVLGQYRVVKIGVESVTVEYLDGRGRQTIPMRG
jgi:hypothetical protein